MGAGGGWDGDGCWVLGSKWNGGGGGGRWTIHFLLGLCISFWLFGNFLRRFYLFIIYIPVYHGRNTRGEKDGSFLLAEEWGLYEQTDKSNVYDTTDNRQQTKQNPQ